MSLAALPDADGLIIGGIWRRGRQVRALCTQAGPPVAIAWVTDRAVRGAGLAWAGLGEDAPKTGLQPILLSGLDGGTARPWDDGEFGDPQDPGSIDRTDVALLLEGWWWDDPEEYEQDEDLRATLSRFGPRFPGWRPLSARSWD